MLDQHQWDAYFALFAQDASVPWKTTNVRLDTYSGAPVDFAAYAIDPAEVIVAGGNHPARAIDTSHRQATTHWRFSPPPGYRFETSDVPVPLGSSEGFFVIEARRGDASQQVWVNRSRIGLVTKESPQGLVVWGVDLRSGRAMRNLHVEFLSGGKLVSRTTDSNGLIVWRDSRRPVFALADSGASRAFVSLLPQAPLPQSIIGVRVESAVVRAGENVAVAGFARRRSGGVLQRGSGEAKLTLVGHGTTLATTAVRLDSSGAFFGELAVPTSAAAGDYAVLASAAGGVGGTSVHVDAGSSLTLGIESSCPCNSDDAVPFTITAQHNGAAAQGVPVTVDVVRTPHVVPPGESQATPRWGTTNVLHSTVVTGADGRARVKIPQPTDGLASTYGVSASTAGDGATATTQIVVPTSPLALAVEPDATAADVGQPVGFEVRGFVAADGSPAAGIDVTLRLSHGATVSEQTLRLDASGRAHAVFASPSLGSNLAIAQTAAANGKTALDAAAVTVAPQGLSGTTSAAESNMSVALDRPRYHVGDHVGVSISASGAGGDALVTLEGARTYASRIVPISGGHGSATVDLGTVEGDARIGVAVVRDGAVALGSATLAIDAPGHARVMSLAPDHPSYEPGSVASIAIHDGETTSDSTLIVRLTAGLPSGGAVLDDLPLVLSSGGTTSQTSAPENPAWHTWVAPARSKASDIFAAERPTGVRRETPSIGAAAPRTLAWRTVRSSGTTIEVPLPKEPGTYLVSVVRVFDDGDVGAAATSVTVR